MNTYRCQSYSRFNQRIENVDTRGHQPPNNGQRGPEFEVMEGEIPGR